MPPTPLSPNVFYKTNKNRKNKKEKIDLKKGSKKERDEIAVGPMVNIKPLWGKVNPLPVWK